MYSGGYAQLLRASCIAPLAGLTNLTRLSLGSNEISDLAPLTGLTNLTVLSLESNEISDLAPLTSLTNLTWLSLESNEISDLAPLAGLTNLTGLSLESNEISNLGPLAGLTNLTSLYLWDNEISDLGPLAGLTNLTWLSLESNDVSDLGHLAGLTNLTVLSLESNEVSDLGPLTDLTNLRRLHLSDNVIRDVSPLAGLTRLRWLFLTGNEISDLWALVENSNAGGLWAGAEVDLRENHLDLTPGSQAMQDIRTLLDRGVKVAYEPQNVVPGPPTPTIRFESPRGGEVWTGGSTATIIWTASHLSPDGRIDIYYWKDGWQQVAGGLSSRATSFSWVVPNTPTDSSRLFIGNNVEGAWEAAAQSNTFAIRGATGETSAQPCGITVQPGESVQEAIDAAPEGAVICLAEGEWEERILVTKSLTIRGQEGKTVLRLPPASALTGPSPYTLLTVRSNVRAEEQHESQGVQVTLQALSLIGEAHYRGYQRNGIVLEGYALEVRITNCTVSDFNNGFGVQLVGSRSTDSDDRFPQATITNCTVTGNRDGIAIYAIFSPDFTDIIARATIMDCYIADNDGTGIFLGYTAQATIVGNEILRNVCGVTIEERQARFKGYVTGGKNLIPAPFTWYLPYRRECDPDANRRAPFCPLYGGRGLSFLRTVEGGSLGTPR